jgi:hypothetical protein
MAVVVKRHIDTPQADGEYAVITPEVAPLLKVMRYADLTIDVSVTGSVSNWQELVVQNSAKPGWIQRYGRREMDWQRARDPGDWFRFPLGPNDLVEGEPNCISIRLIDKGSHRSAVNLLGANLGRVGISNPNLLAFTLEVADKSSYPYTRSDGGIRADEKWGVTDEASHLILSEESGWATTKPNWFDEEVRGSIQVRPPVSTAQPRRRPDPSERDDPPRPDPPAPRREIIGSDRLEVEILDVAHGVQFEVRRDVINVTRPIASATRWSYGRSMRQTVNSPTNGLQVPWRPGVSADVSLDIKRPDGRWQNNVALIRVTAIGGRR